MIDKRMWLVEQISADIIHFLMKDNSIDIEKAMNIFYNSKLALKLNDLETGYYTYSSLHVYEHLKEEVKN